MSNTTKFVAYTRALNSVTAPASLKAQCLKLQDFADNNSGEIVQTFSETADLHNSRAQLLAAVELCQLKGLVLLIQTLESLDSNGRTISDLYVKGVRVLCAQLPTLNTRQLALIQGTERKTA
jgi:hypothetical protein